MPQDRPRLHKHLQLLVLFSTQPMCAVVTAGLFACRRQQCRLCTLNMMAWPYKLMRPWGVLGHMRSPAAAHRQQQPKHHPLCLCKLGG